MKNMTMMTIKQEGAVYGPQGLKRHRNAEETHKARNKHSLSLGHAGGSGPPIIDELHGQGAQTDTQEDAEEEPTEERDEGHHVDGESQRHLPLELALADVVLKVG